MKKEKVEASLKSTVKGILTAAPIRNKFHKAMFNHHMEHHKEHMRSAAKHMHEMQKSDPNSKKYVYHQNQALHHLGNAEHHVNMAHHHTMARLNTQGYDKKFIKDFHKKFNDNKDKAKGLIDQHKNGTPLPAKPVNKPKGPNKRGRPPSFKQQEAPPIKTNKPKPRQDMPAEETVPKRKIKSLNPTPQPKPNKPAPVVNKPKANKVQPRPKKL